VCTKYPDTIIKKETKYKRTIKKKTPLPPSSVFYYYLIAQGEGETFINSYVILLLRSITITITIHIYYATTKCDKMKKKQK